MGLPLTLVAWLQEALPRAVCAHPGALYPALKSFLAKAAGWRVSCVGAEPCSHGPASPPTAHPLLSQRTSGVL